MSAAEPLLPFTPTTMRPLQTPAELEACVALQRLTWGERFREVVPVSILRIAARLGGVVAGAFEDDDLIGFVFGMTGLEAGRLVHWSHMLAVRPDRRDRGVGRALKHFQREVLASTGVERIAWTFDPLVARNAHINLNRLGATVERYERDMYGDTGSDLHVTGTDRLVVTWPVEGALPAPARMPALAMDAPLVDGMGPPDQGSMARIEIPSDIEGMIPRDLGAARGWRASSRVAFQRCLAEGWRVRSFMRDDAGRCYYLLDRKSIEHT